VEPEEGYNHDGERGRAVATRF